MTLTEILADIEANTYTLEQLRGLVAQASVTANNAAPNAVTLLYSGYLPGGVHSGSVAEAISDQSRNSENLKQVITIADTDAANLLKSRQLEDALDRATQNLSETDAAALKSQFFEGVTDTNGVRTQPGVWDEVSARFAQRAEGDVRTITPHAADSSVFSQSELKALLENPTVPSIDGITKTDLMRLYDAELTRTGNAVDALSTVRSAISANSVAQVMGMRVATEIDPTTGKVIGVTGVDTGKFFDATPNIVGTHLPDDTPYVTSFDNLIQDMTPAQRADYIRGMEAAREGGRLAELAGVSHALNKLGIIGDALGLLLAASDAHAAYSAGDTARANDILADWAGGLVGGLVGGLAVAKLAAMAALPIAAMGPVGALVSGVISLGAGLIGGIYGEEAGKKIADLVSDHFTAAQRFIPQRDPLALDLDGDGIETVGIIGYDTVLFDHDGDGIKTGTGWVKSDDGLLVLDGNGNGAIDNGSELFGVDYIKSNQQRATDGFDALRDLDVNADGIFDANDSQFGNLRIWRDLNQDGISQAGELQSLTDTGVASISLSALGTNTDLGNDNTLTQTATLSRTDGSAGTAGNLNLTQNAFYREFTDQIALTGQAQSLPAMQGSGGVRDLRQAASLSADLADLLANFATRTTRAEQQALLDGLLKTWSETSAFVTSAGGAHGSPAISFQGVTIGSQEHQQWLDKLSILERFNGQTFRNSNSFTIEAEAMTLLNQSYAALRDSVYSQLALQTHLKPYLETIRLNVTADGAALDFTGINALLEHNKQIDAQKAFSDLLELQAYAGDSLNANGWKGLERIIKWAGELPGSVNVTALLTEFGYNAVTSDNDLLIGTSGDDNLHGQEGDDTLYGGAGNDTLSGGRGTNVLDGGDGDDMLIGAIESTDILRGGAGNDTLQLHYWTYAGTLHGGQGNDTLIGGHNGDTYLFNLGDGQDRITDYQSYAQAGQTDRVVFGAGITPGDIQLERSTSDLILRHLNGTDQLTIANWYQSSANHIERFEFTDGTVWLPTTIDDLLPVWLGTAGNDVMIGANGDDKIAGGAGNDTLNGGRGTNVLEGGDGDDMLIGATESTNILRGGAGGDTLLLDYWVYASTLEGGQGNDTLIGGHNGDTYVFNPGDGQDRIIDFQSYAQAGQNDRLALGVGIAHDQLWFRHVGSDLEISIVGTSDKVTVGNWYSGSSYHVEQLQTADGKTLLDTQVENLVSAMAAFSPPPPGQTTLPQNYQEALAPVLAANWS
jgi:Ca2+-binding RTX toxin-like protein